MAIKKSFRSSIIIGGLAVLSMIGFGAFSQADEVQTESNNSAQPAQDNDSMLMINTETKEVVRVDRNGNATPVSAEEMQNLVAQADAQRSINQNALRGGGGGGGHGGFGGGGGRGGFGGGGGFGRGGGGFGRGGFGGGGFGRGGGGFGRGGFGRGGGGFGRGGFGRGGGWRGGRWYRGGYGWAPYYPCDVYPYDPNYCY